MQPSKIRDVSSIPSLFVRFVRERPEANFVFVPEGEQPDIDWCGISRQEALEHVAGLAKRFENKWPLAEYNEDTFYTPGKEGYIDYPAYEEQQES